MEIINQSNFSVLISNEYNECRFTNVILLRYVGILIFFIGIFSTLLSICVFSRKPLRRKSCCFYFLILAISDSIHLTTMTIEHFRFSFNIDLVIIHSSICKIVIFMIYCSNHLSNIVLTLASIDRFILIYYPTQSKKLCKTSKAHRLVFIVVVVLLISNGHILYGYEKVSIPGIADQFIYDCNIHLDNLLYKRIFHFYDSYIESVCFVLIPFIIMSLCSILIIVQILQSRRKHRNSQRARLRDKDIQSCCMLIGTSITFLLLCLPAEINDLTNYTYHDQRVCVHWFRKVLFMLLQQIYCAGHFYIYTLTGQIFRKQLYAIFFQRKKPTRTQRRPPQQAEKMKKQFLITQTNRSLVQISDSQVIFPC